MRVEGELGENFGIKVGVSQGWIVSQRLFHIFMDGSTREIKVSVGDVGTR